jgi:hypothetical protein
MDRLLAALRQSKLPRARIGVREAHGRRSLARPLGAVIGSLVVLGLAILGFYLWPNEVRTILGQRKPQSDPVEGAGLPAKPEPRPSVAAIHKTDPAGHGSAKSPAPKAKNKVESIAAAKTGSAAPRPPRPTAPAERKAPPAGDTELASLFNSMRKTDSREPIRVALWIAAPILKGDMPIFLALADDMHVGGARLDAISLPANVLPGRLDSRIVRSDDLHDVGGLAVQRSRLDSRILRFDDPRRILDTKPIDAVIIYGILRTDAVYPEFLVRLAPSPAQRANLALVWCSQAGKDSFLVMPDNELDISRLKLGDVVLGEDAVSAAAKYARIVCVGTKPNDFREFFESVKSRAIGPNHISKRVQ